MQQNDDAIPKKELSLSGTFYRRRDDWIGHILRRPKSEYSHVEKCVAIYVAETINPRDREWSTSQEKIAKDLDVGIRIVKSAIAKLKSDGLLTIKREKINGSVKTFNHYALVAVEDAIPLSKVHGRARS
ncbi:hypothetical protein [Rhizobium sp.]|uniref:hypothetical protein n=1 Tax=Rhizobium sp. TaxID=391 RepID=UPI003F7CD41E